MRTEHAGILAVLSLGIALVLPSLAQDNQASDAGFGNSATNAGDVTKATIFYSGHMFGYLREDGDSQACGRTKARECHVSGPARIFEKALEGRGCGRFEESTGTYIAGSTCVLLGMGDNFAPKYEARLKDTGEFKDRNDSVTTYRGDNVARFLDTARFNALIPGKEDFYFGPYRLWRIADSLNKRRCRDAQVKDPLPADNSVRHPRDEKDPCRDASVDGPFLADNLVLRPTDEKDREPWQESRKKFTDKVEGIKAKFSGKAMPWLVKLTFQLDRKLISIDESNFEGYLCRAGSNPDDIPTNNITKDPNCKKWDRPDKTKDEFVRSQAKRKTPDDKDKFPPRNDLVPGADYGFCLTGITFRGSQEPYCLPIHVEVPMFGTPYVFVQDNNVAIFAVVDPDLRSYIPKQNAGWKVLDSAGRVLKKSVRDDGGKTDWIPHSVEIATLPPQDALEQALDAFLLDHGPFTGRTVLMAQMDMGHADELARNLSAPDSLKLNPKKPNEEKDTPDEPAFDLVIARSDSTHQTRPQTIIFDKPENARPRFVAVPPAAWDDNKLEIRVPLGWIDLTRTNNSTTADFHVDVEYCARKDKDGKLLPSPEGCIAGPASPAWNELENRLFRQVSKEPYKRCYQAMGNSTPDDCQGTRIAACLRKFAICAMLQDSKTIDTKASDIALLQERDLWIPDKDKDKEDNKRAWRIHWAEAPKVQGILDRIFWKDDLLTHANLSGSELKGLAKKSEDYKKEEETPHWLVRDTKGRWLETSGLLKGTDPRPGAKEPSYYAHLEEVSDTAIYRVAASSYLSNGDTGYAEFAKPAEGKVEFLATDKTGVRISVLICEALLQGAKERLSKEQKKQKEEKEELYGCNGASSSESSKDGTVDERDYAVSSDETKKIAGLLIHDDREQDGPREYLEAQVRELVTGRDPFSAKGPAAGTPGSESEKRLQNYSYLDVNLEQLAIAGTLNTALASRAETANFGGVLQSDIPQPTKSEFSWNTKFRVLYRHGRWDFGGAINEQFDKSVQGSLTKPSSPSWSSNSLAVGPIVQFSMSDPRRAPRHLLTFHLPDFIPQITNTSLSLSGAKNSAGVASASFTLSQRRSYGIQPKVGYRGESGDSYFEFGGLYARNYDVLSEIAGLPDDKVCDISGSISLSDCVGNIPFPPGFSQTLLILHYSNFSQAGIYWDGKLSIDVFKGKWSYLFTSSGNYYPISDSVSALTRLDAKLGNSLKFPLFGNFSLVPAAEWRFFENQGTRDFLKRVNTSVALTYSFHKDSRVRLLDAMRYKASGSNP
jgi:hypothetical protein